ncbi:MAG: hypothetical protein AAGA92_04480 [Planctomycetota bacterium]
MRTACLTTLLLATAAAQLPPSPVRAQPATPSTIGSTTFGPGLQVSLSDQLRVGLRAVTKADFAFIDKVVTLVNTGKLPRSLVDSTFFWSRRRAALRGPKRALRPMVFFRPGLTLRAKAIGITI